MNAWLPQASYPCGNFSDTSRVKLRQSKGSLGHAFTVYIRTENLNQISFSPFGPHEISVLIELILGHLCYHLTDVPPQPNSPPDSVYGKDRSHPMNSHPTYRPAVPSPPAQPAPRRASIASRPKSDEPEPSSEGGHLILEKEGLEALFPANRISETTSGVVVFHRRVSSHLCYTSQVISQCQTRVKLNRVFFPR